MAYIGPKEDNLEKYDDRMIGEEKQAIYEMRRLKMNKLKKC